jgi:hypothetical protein
MTRLKVEGVRKDVYADNYLSFAFVNRDEEGDRKQCGNFRSCKDFLHDDVQAFLMRKDNWERYNKAIDVSHIRMLVKAPQRFTKKKTVSEFRKNLYNYKRFINFYERVAGWKKTLMTRADHSAEKCVWLMTGPGGWMKASYLISMFALIMRLSVNESIKIDENKSIEATRRQVEEFFQYLIEQNTQGDYVKGRDIGYLAKCWKKFFLVAKYQEELFGGLSLKEAYSPIGHSSGGIVSFCTFNSAHPKLNTQFKKICEKHGV